jgi:hypothetical protein
MPLLLFKSLTLQSFLNKNHPTLFPRVFGGFVQAQLVHSVFFEFCGEKHKNSFLPGSEMVAGTGGKVHVWWRIRSHLSHSLTHTHTYENKMGGN